MEATVRTLRQDAKVIGLISVAHGLSHFYQLVIAVLFPLIKTDLGVSYAALGATTALFYVVSGLCQTAAGFMVDRYGARRVLIGGLALCSAGVLLAGFAQHYAMLVAAAAVAGVGNSVFHPADFAILNARVDQKRLGYAFSFHGFAGTMGWALAPVFSYGVSALYGWHTALMLSAAVAFAQNNHDVVVRPREIDTVLVNPGMGIETFQRFNGDALNPGLRLSEAGPTTAVQPAAVQPDFPESSISYCRWFWNQVVAIIYSKLPKTFAKTYK